MTARTNIAFMLAFTGVVLVGCATKSLTSDAGQTTDSAVSYDKVITGAFGFVFGVIDTNALKGEGFEEETLPSRYIDVGKWTKITSNKDEFFNFITELVVSPNSNLLGSITGKRFYKSREYVDHFKACMDDYRAIITQLENKYPTLVRHIGILSNIYKADEYSSSSYSEGVTQLKHSKEYLGRGVEVICSIQESGAKVIGSMLTVRYDEERKIADLITEEQKRVFKSKSRQRLKDKGLNADQL